MALELGLSFPQDSFCLLAKTTPLAHFQCLVLGVRAGAEEEEEEALGNENLRVT